MPSASALFAPIVSASAGTTLAAPGAQGPDAALFSSKVADVLQIAAETEIHGRRSDYRQITFLTAVQVQADNPQAKSAEAESPKTKSPQADINLQPAAPADPQPPASAEAADVAPEETVADDGSDLPTSAEAPLREDPPVASAEPVFVPAPPPIIAPVPQEAPAAKDTAAPSPTPAIHAANDSGETPAIHAADGSGKVPIAEKPAASIAPHIAPPADLLAATTDAPAGAVSQPEAAPPSPSAEVGSEATTAVHAEAAPLKTVDALLKAEASVEAAPPKTAPAPPAPPADVPEHPAVQSASPDATAKDAPTATVAIAPKSIPDAAPAQDAAETGVQRLAEAVAAVAKVDPAKVEVKVSRPQPIKASIDPAPPTPLIVQDPDDRDAAPTTVATQAPTTDASGSAPIATPTLKPAPHNDHPPLRNAAVKDDDKAEKDVLSDTSKALTADAAPSVAKANAPATPQTEAAAPAPGATPIIPPTTSSAVAHPVEAQQIQQHAAVDRNLGLSTLSHATIETTAQIAAQIARKLDSRSTRFDMVLTPEDLGRVDVSLEIDADGQLAARLAFDNPAAAADLRGRADELRRQLQDAGFQVSSDALDFSHRDPSAGGGAFERQQQRNALFSGGSRLALQADALPIPAPGAWTNLSQTPDRVDVRV